MATAKTQTLSTVVQTVATSRKINATDAGKRVRSYIRSHRADLEKVWPALKQHSKGDRYQPMPLAASKAITEAVGKSKS